MKLSCIIIGRDNTATIGYTIRTLYYSIKYSGLSREAEVIVVAADKQTYTKAEETLSKLHGIRYKTMIGPRKGTSYARNLGYKASIGDVIVFIDGDMIIPPAFIKKAIEEAGNYDLIAPVTLTLRIDKPSHYHSIYELFTYTLTPPEGARDPSLNPPARIFKRRVLDKIGGYPTYSRYFAEDRIATSLGIKAGFKYKWCRNIVLIKIERGSLRSIIDKYIRYGYGIACDLDKKGLGILRGFIIFRRLAYINILFPLLSILYTAKAYRLLKRRALYILYWKYLIDLLMFLGEIKGKIKRCR